jgi:hypothetical protein
VDEQGVSIAGDRCGQLIGGVQQPSSAGFSGKQQQLAKGDDPCVVPRGMALDVTDFIRQTEVLALHPSFSRSTLDSQAAHFSPLLDPIQ